MSYSDIEWLRAPDGSRGKTWNPIRGCTPISPGCKFCYAERMAARNLPEGRSPSTGKPFAVIHNGRPHWTGDVEFIPSKLFEPLHWKKPCRVFVNSVSDLFHEDVPFEHIVDIMAVMALTPHITYLTLTKRARRMQELMNGEGLKHVVLGRAWTILGSFPKFVHQSVLTRPWPLPNWQVGVSIENKETAAARLPDLFRTPAALRWVSYEPALEYVDLCVYLRHLQTFRSRGAYDTEDLIETRYQGVDWLVIGGESGPGARPFDIEGARGTVRHCAEAGVPIFVKQLGANPVRVCGDYVLDLKHPLKDKKGADMDEWPEDLRVRQYPKVA